MGHVASLGDKENIYSRLMEKPEGQRRLGMPRCRWEGNIKTYLKETELQSVKWINLADDRNKYQTVLDMVTNTLLKKSAGVFLTSSRTVDLAVWNSNTAVT